MVYQVIEQTQGRRYVHELHSLKLPNGDYAHKLAREDLLKALLDLKIPGVEKHFGHQQLSMTYSRYLFDQEQHDKQPAITPSR